MPNQLHRCPHYRHYFRTGLAALVIGTACDSPAEPVSPRVLAVSTKPAPQAPVHVVNVVLDAAAPVMLEYWFPGGPRLRISNDDLARSHTLLAAQLRPETEYQFEVTPSDGEPTTGTFTTAALPASLSALEFNAEGTPSQPLTLIEIARNEGGFRGAVIVDESGEVVWYRELESLQGATVRENGNFVFLDVARGVQEITPAGELVTELSQGIPSGRRSHHDVITTPRNTLLVLSSDTREYRGRMIVGEAIWEWNPDNGDLARRWSSWDHLSPEADWSPASRDSDWLHANAIALAPDGNVLLSLRFTDQVISIARDFSSLEWRLGGLNADVMVAGDDVFIGQHTAAELIPNGPKPRVLLFDNGSIGRGFSRAQELELDLSTGTATTVWEFRPQPDNFSFIVSSARRLDNGNTFVAFGAGPDVASSFGPVEVYEVPPTGDVQFRVQVSGDPVAQNFIMYRAWPLSTIAGEGVIVP